MAHMQFIHSLTSSLKTSRSRAENLYLAAVDQAKPSYYTLPRTPDRTTAEHIFWGNLGKVADLSAED